MLKTISPFRMISCSTMIHSFVLTIIWQHEHKCILGFVMLIWFDLTHSNLGNIFNRRHIEIFYFFPEKSIRHFIQVISSGKIRKISRMCRLLSWPRECLRLKLSLIYHLCKIHYNNKEIQFTLTMLDINFKFWSFIPQKRGFDSSCKFSL